MQNEKIEKLEFNKAIDSVNQSPEVIKIFKDYIKKPFGFMVLSGRNGTGKSFAARAIMESIPYDDRLDANHQFQSPFKKFITQSSLNILWQNHFNENGNTFYLLNQLIFTKILVLDDLGTRVPSVAFMDFLYVLADERYSRKETCGTIITTNLNSDDFRNAMGDAFLSRVASNICLRFEGCDRRVNKETQKNTPNPTQDQTKQVSQYQGSSP